MNLLDKVLAFFVWEDIPMLPIDGIRMISTRNGFKLDYKSLRGTGKNKEQIEAAKKLAGIQ